ncbi:Predicted RNA binding protein YcfA, dsRBD-like fold, HicA-like mRNA interferase family [Fontimonas thermophila]|uniref:Predicted RNA binding protein YcfA, dsRBD-like fold, HicA-like mRNA interferase family n=1 Tax=Fontimonas thermophila TaxID=1076937 RepID=A0A1I2HCK1_9GAMM|nr:type II toxin-antitoxin system HicA family toxin [Fontimonas thermophila]SFF27382.1 Predicted RNA binding protein YcfA, dsRBD-like fold, HicA-like mRNA interferase family [Fontimonas thermophila]
MNGKEVIKWLQRARFRVERVRGSRHLLTDGRRKVTVPVQVHGASDIRIGTLKSIEKQSGVKLT